MSVGGSHFLGGTRASFGMPLPSDHSLWWVSGEPPAGAFNKPLAWTPQAGLKPVADQIRRMMPFGSPKRERQHDQTRRNAGGDA